MKIVLPVPPSANVYWRTYVLRGKVPRAVTVPSDEAKRYKATVASAGLRVAFKKTDKPCVVSVRWYRARKSGDLDNRLKVLIDALKGVAFDDDDQVVEIHAWRDDDKENPRVEVEVVAA